MLWERHRRVVFLLPWATYYLMIGKHYSRISGRTTHWAHPDDPPPHPGDPCRSIRVSANNIGTSDALVQALAHEMIHAYQYGVARTGTRAMHNTEFKRLATRVCKVHGWKTEGFAK